MSDTITQIYCTSFLKNSIPGREIENGPGRNDFPKQITVIAGTIGGGAVSGGAAYLAVTGTATGAEVANAITGPAVVIVGAVVAGGVGFGYLSWKVYKTYFDHHTVY